jgi:hypothetical protein
MGLPAVLAASSLNEVTKVEEGNVAKVPAPQPP